MAKFEFHGQEDLIDKLEDELPRDGTSWDRFLLEAVRNYEGKDPLPPNLSRSVSLSHELQDMLPDDRDESIKYIKESVEMRKNVEGGEVVLVDSDNFPLKEDHTV